MGKSQTDIYLELTGQSWDYLMQGEQTYGLAFILYLVTRCIDENKKIIWQRGGDDMYYSLIENIQ